MLLHNPHTGVTIAKVFCAAIVFILLVTTSCRTIDVATSDKIQKRKYRHGYYVRNDNQRRKMLNTGTTEGKNDRHAGADLNGQDQYRKDTLTCLASKDPYIVSNHYKAGSEIYQIDNVIQKTPRKQDILFVREPLKNKAPRNIKDVYGKVMGGADRSDNNRQFGAISFMIAVLGLIIPTAAPVAIVASIMAVNDEGDAWSIIALILSFLEFFGWVILLVFLILAGFTAWAWAVFILLAIPFAAAIIYGIFVGIWALMSI